MAALQTTADYIREARELLQDMVAPYRYPDTTLVSGLNMAMTEIARLRPDILQEMTYTQRVNRRWTANQLVAPIYSEARPTEAVALPIQYQMPTLLYVVGYTQLRDSEDFQDQRAASFIGSFVQKLITIAA